MHPTALGPIDCFRFLSFFGIIPRRSHDYLQSTPAAEPGGPMPDQSASALEELS
jgi:hypothetical protein